MKSIFKIISVTIFCLISVAASASHDVKLFVGKPNSQWQIAVENPDGKATLTAGSVNAPKIPESSAPNSEVTVQLSSKKLKDDALTFRWKDSWRAGLTFTSETPVDIRPYQKGVIAFDFKVDDLAKGGVAFKLSCGNNCERQVPFTLPARELAGKGWQQLALPVDCFIHDGDDLSAIKMPFALETGGTGQVAIANVKIKATGKGNVSCTDYKSVSVTPSMLNEWWSIDWWLPRHEKKLREIKTRPIDLVFIGDSITEGWEKSGVPVWEKYYGKRNALDLGFGGDRTENILWRLQHGEVEGLHPKVAVLMFGTNNTGHRHEAPELTARGIKRDLDELRQRLPQTKLLLLAIFPRDEKPDGELRQINNRINAIISGFADNKTVFFLDINKAFLDEKGVLSKNIMPDLLHPNEKGYEIWASNMEPTLAELLKD